MSLAVDSKASGARSDIATPDEEALFDLAQMRIGAGGCGEPALQRSRPDQKPLDDSSIGRTGSTSYPRSSSAYLK